MHLSSLREGAVSARAPCFEVITSTDRNSFARVSICGQTVMKKRKTCLFQIAARSPTYNAKKTKLRIVATSKSMRLYRPCSAFTSPVDFSVAILCKPPVADGTNHGTHTQSQGQRAKGRGKETWKDKGRRGQSKGPQDQHDWVGSVVGCALVTTRCGQPVYG